MLTPPFWLIYLSCKVISQSLISCEVTLKRLNDIVCIKKGNTAKCVDSSSMRSHLFHFDWFKEVTWFENHDQWPKWTMNKFMLIKLICWPYTLCSIVNLLLLHGNVSLWEQAKHSSNIRVVAYSVQRTRCCALESRKCQPQYRSQQHKLTQQY